MKRSLALMTWTLAGCVGFIVCGCKPKEPPAPPKPSVAPLGQMSAPAPRTAARSGGELPPGHPPIDQPGKTTEQPVGSNALPPGHPPINQPAASGNESASNEGLPPGHPPVGGASGGSAPAAGGMGMPPAIPKEMKFVEPTTQFAGVSLTPPAGWKAFEAGSGPLAPVAAFLLERVEGDSADASARLTYFPNMRDTVTLDSQLERWYGQVQQADGKPTSEVAKRETFEAGGATITVADMTGSISGVPDQRMIAAVIIHPEGPHFLKVQGPAKTIEKWHDSVIEYLKSAKVGQ
jgi:hypothetical protein